MAIAVSATGRLQDLHDVNVTPGAGNDGYALTWDDATSRFVLAAVAAAGLAADGSVTGATSQAQAFTVGVSLADTTTSATGVVWKGSDRFLHNFHHPTGQTAQPVGNNLFLGVLAGNFTMGSTATNAAHASRNIGIGYDTLTALTTGYQNVALGVSAGNSITTGYDNFACGYLSLDALTTGYQNVAIGNSALRMVSGSNNIGLGNLAGRFQADGATALTGVNNSIYIGGSCRGFNDSDNNSIVIGNAAIGQGANTTVIGNTSTTLTELPGGALRLKEMAAAPTGVTDKATLYTKDNGAGKTQLCCKLGDDVEIVLATQA